MYLPDRLTPSELHVYLKNATTEETFTQPKQIAIFIILLSTFQYLLRFLDLFEDEEEGDLDLDLDRDRRLRLDLRSRDLDLERDRDELELLRCRLFFFLLLDRPDS